MNPSHVRQRLMADHVVIGPILNFNSPWFVDIAGLCGFDFVLIDCEHGPMVPESAEQMIRAADAAGVSPLVRVPTNLPHEILRYLDLGAVGVMVPHIETADQARAAARATRYAPRGERGLAMSTRAATYGAGATSKEYVALANREVMLIAMVETALAVENIDAIAATDGVDLIALGPADLSMSMGYGGDRNHAELSDAIQHVIDRASAHGKWCSLPASNPEQAAQCIAQGVNLIFVGSSAWLVEAGRRFLTDTRGAKAS